MRRETFFESGKSPAFATPDGNIAVNRGAGPKSGLYLDVTSESRASRAQCGAFCNEAAAIWK